MTTETSRRVEVPAPPAPPAPAQGAEGKATGTPGAETRPSKPNVPTLPEAKFLFMVQDFVPVPADDKHGGNRLSVTVAQAGQFYGRSLVARIFSQSPIEDKLKMALGVDKGEQIDASAIKGRLLFGYTVNKPRKDGQGMFTIIGDFKAAVIQEAAVEKDVPI